MFGQVAVSQEESLAVDVVTRTMRIGSLPALGALEGESVGDAAPA